MVGWTSVVSSAFGSIGWFRLVGGGAASVQRRVKWASSYSRPGAPAVPAPSGCPLRPPSGASRTNEVARGPPNSTTPQPFSQSILSDARTPSREGNLIDHDACRSQIEPGLVGQIIRPNRMKTAVLSRCWLMSGNWWYRGPLPGERALPRRNSLPQWTMRGGRRRRDGGFGHSPTTYPT